MVLTAFEVPTAGKSVKVKILQDTVAGGKDVFRGEEHTVSHADYLQLKYGNKCELVEQPEFAVEPVGAEVRDVQVEITNATRAAGGDHFPGEVIQVSQREAAILVSERKAKVLETPAEEEKQTAEPDPAAETGAAAGLDGAGDLPPVQAELAPADPEPSPVVATTSRGRARRG